MYMYTCNPRNSNETNNLPLVLYEVDAAISSSYNNLTGSTIDGVTFWLIVTQFGFPKIQLVTKWEVKSRTAKLEGIKEP